MMRRMESTRASSRCLLKLLFVLVKPLILLMHIILINLLLLVMHMILLILLLLLMHMFQLKFLLMLMHMSLLKFLFLLMLLYRGWVGQPGLPVLGNVLKHMPRHVLMHMPVLGNVLMHMPVRHVPKHVLSL